MTNGDCSADEKVSSSRGNSDSGDIQTFTQHERHQSIVRQQLLSKLSVELAPIMKQGNKILALVGERIDDSIDEMGVQISKDGLDVDNELLNILSDISGDLYAVQTKFQEIQKRIKQSNKGT
tara:strand:+ start:5895 stop:6260 length:366 start_codon:yes stop_codon:yes gene_type:complete